MFEVRLGSCWIEGADTEKEEEITAKNEIIQYHILAVL
jgi:hypothetical protein